MHWHQGNPEPERPEERKPTRRGNRSIPAMIAKISSPVLRGLAEQSMNLRLEDMKQLQRDAFSLANVVKELAEKKNVSKNKCKNGEPDHNADETVTTSSGSKNNAVKKRDGRGLR